MATPRQQAIVRSTQLLAAVKKSAESAPSVPETRIREYHAVLDKIKTETGIDTASYRIADTDIQPVLTSFDSFKGQQVFSKEKYAPRPLFMDRINGALKALEAGLAAKS